MTADGSSPLDLDEAWTPEHLVLAGLARCTLQSLRFHATPLGIDFVVGLGDYIYEATGDTGPRQDHIGPDDSSQTLPEYRHKYRLYKSDPNLRAMHEAHAYFAPVAVRA